MCQEAHKKKASDIHLVVGKPPYLRIDGELEELKGLKPLTKSAVLDMILKVLNKTQHDTFVNDKELDLSYQIDEGIRFRVNLHWEKDNPGLVARLIPANIPTMDEIGMPEMVSKIIALNQGLILVTGPTGCGKSTSLATMINTIAKQRRCHIMTLEDPIEFVFKSDKSIVKQRQLNTDMISFAEGLKHVLRQDPNIVMVGEMRDLETIATTITLAETGHLVLATLHTYSAAQTIDRIIDIFPPHQQNQIRLQLSMTLVSIISQRLLPRQGGGRIASRELLINNAAVSNLIRENKIAQIKSTIQTSAEEGMFTMDQNLKELYEHGLITLEVATMYMENPEEIKG